MLKAKDILDALEIGLDSFDDSDMNDITTLGDDKAEAIIRVLSDSGEWSTFSVTVSPRT